MPTVEADRAAALSPRDELARWEEAASASGAVFMPIRHHSPACARHLATLVRELRPAAVLVEGPEELTPLVPLLLHPETRPPVAFYTTCDGGGRRSGKGAGTKKEPAERAVAFYPLCDASPELVALREGTRSGAELSFIDLSWAAQVRARRGQPQGVSGSPEADAEHRAVSLLEEGHMARSEMIRALAERTGCRDHDELWDHLFELRHRHLEGAAFRREVLAYCLLARLDYAPEALEADATLPRERAMAASIRTAVAEHGAGRVLVVTGGFHTVNLPFLLADPALPERPDLDPGGTATRATLVRYSFDRLDALHGYGAGMPSPLYQHRVWSALERGEVEPQVAAAAETLVEIGRSSRKHDLAERISPADEIAALDTARRLAALRGRPAPARADLLDAVRSCFLKGAVDPATEWSPLMALVRDAMSGRRKGEVPAEAGLPPIVEDFRRRAAALRLSSDVAEEKRLALDLYRKRRHREQSRFLHALGFLGVPLARPAGGPDFVAGVDLDRLREHWIVAWSPQVEAALVEAAVYGDTIDEACLGRLRATAAALEEEGLARDASEAVRLLVVACRMGLARHAAELVERIDENLAEDASFPSLVAALSQLLILWTSREPLEAHHLQALPRLLATAYRRACFLLGELGEAMPEDDPQRDEPSALEALLALGQALEASPELDPELLYATLGRLVDGRDTPPLLAGAATGLLFGAGYLGEAAVLRGIEGRLAGGRAGAGGAADSVAALRGLLRTAREVLWRVPGLLERLDARLSAWQPDELMAHLPHLRLALSELTPREVDRVARAVARLHGVDDPGQLAHPDLGASELERNLRLGARLRRVLERDGLAGRRVEPEGPGSDEGAGQAAVGGSS